MLSYSSPVVPFPFLPVFVSHIPFFDALFFRVIERPPCLPEVCFIAGFHGISGICCPGVFRLWRVRAVIFVLCGLAVPILGFFIARSIGSIGNWDYVFELTVHFSCLFLFLWLILCLFFTRSLPFSIAHLSYRPFFIAVVMCCCSFRLSSLSAIVGALESCSVCVPWDVPRSMISTDLCEWVFCILLFWWGTFRNPGMLFFLLLPLLRGWTWCFLFCLLCWDGPLILVWVHIFFCPGWRPRSVSIMWLCSVSVLSWWLFLPGSSREPVSRGQTFLLFVYCVFVLEVSGLSYEGDSWRMPVTDRFVGFPFTVWGETSIGVFVNGDIMSCGVNISSGSIGMFLSSSASCCEFLQWYLVFS